MARTNLNNIIDLQTIIILHAEKVKFIYIVIKFEKYASCIWFIVFDLSELIFFKILIHGILNVYIASFLDTLCNEMYYLDIYVHKYVN